MLKTVSILLTVLVLTACSGFPRVMDELLTSQEQKVQNAKPSARVGMTSFQVINDTHLGKPHRVNRTTGANGTALEMWTYAYGSGRYMSFTFVYLADGVVTRISRHD